jgi:cell division control protein 24
MGGPGTTTKGYPMAAPRQNNIFPQSNQANGTPLPHQSSAVKLVIHHGEDKLVVVALSSINLADLTEKVTKKIRLISGRKGPMEALRIRYIDEDGDKILMHDDEDVQMAFELSRNLGTDVNLVVV